MNKEIKQRWLDALRSGKYQQGRSALRQDGRYCCLGVLCELARQDGIVNAEVLEDGMVTYDDDSQLLPQSVWQWAGLPNFRPSFGGGDLAILNDTGSSFAEIADLIEAHEPD